LAVKSNTSFRVDKVAHRMRWYHTSTNHFTTIMAQAKTNLLSLSEEEKNFDWTAFL